MPAEQEAGRHEERREARRHEEEHRHEHELRRDREPDPDLEPHPRREGVRDDEGRDEERRCGARRVGEERKWNGDREEAEGSDRRDDEIAPDETRRGALSRRFDQLDGFEVGRRLNRARGRSCRSRCHSRTIGAARAAGFPRTRDSAVCTRTSLDQVRQRRRDPTRVRSVLRSTEERGMKGLRLVGVVCGVGALRRCGVCGRCSCRSALVRGQPRARLCPVGRQLALHALPERLSRGRLVRLVALRRAGHPAEQHAPARLVLALTAERQLCDVPGGLRQGRRPGIAVLRPQHGIERRAAQGRGDLQDAARALHVQRHARLRRGRTARGSPARSTGTSS